MRIHLALLCIAVALCGCKKHDDLPESRLAPDACQKIDVLAQVMQCELAPFTRDQSTDEVAFRKALTQLKDLAPSDAAFYQGAKPWPDIVQNMLDTKQYKQGCAECHRNYLRLYRSRYEDSEIPWTNVHAK